MTTQIKKALIVLAGGLLLFLVAKPRLSRDVTPQPKDKPDAATLRRNARTALKAYTAAVSAGEPASRLEELNQELTKEYSLRVQKKGSRYVVVDTTGIEISTETK